jgi:putative flavoprotein involved in K+ transport
MSGRVETIIIGGGQAGLATAYGLKQRRREHLVLDAADRPAHAWRNERWDSFTFVTPNWFLNMPGAAYQGDAPDGFMPRDEIVAFFENYVRRFDLPVRHGVRVDAVEREPEGDLYRVRSAAGEWRARNVVVATGLFQKARIPPLGSALDPDIQQLTTSTYRNPAQLPPGAVLVVGSGQSGMQIAEELYQNGRRVFLSVSGAGRVPRRYRGKDLFHWLDRNGFMDQTSDKLPSPRARFGPNPHLSGRDGGHSLNLHRFARDGVVLCGHIVAAGDSTVRFAPDLKESLAKADKIETDILAGIDAWIREHAPETPPDEAAPRLDDGFRAEDVSEFDLRQAGIRSIIWACGFSWDFSLVKLPVLDADGYPLGTRGLTPFPGLYFVGLPWLHTRGSGTVGRVGADAEHLAATIAARTAPLIHDS